MTTLGQVKAADVAGRWRARAAADEPALDAEPPPGAPAHEYLRSPAAMAVAELAARDGLFLFHYEHRVQLPLPLHWVPEHAPELADPPEWSVGVLPESKYQSFRHDQRCGGFHPGHRAKWSTHELCHGLVGHAWTAEMTPFAHATGGRLAELLPVALYYFFDEAFLRRCGKHAGDGALFRTFCPECEARAALGPARDFDAAEAERLVADGLRFLDRELAAVARTRRSGDVVPSRWATIDLASDGVAYAEAHGRRLASDAMHAWVRRFDRERSVDELIARVEEVALALLGEGPPPERAGDRATWVRQDLGWRIGVVREETDGEAADALDAVLDGLAVDGDVGAAADGYEAVDEDYELAPPEDLQALGYEALDRPTSTLRQVTEGLASCAPGSLQLAGPDAVAGLVELDRARPRRAALPLRWTEVFEDRADPAGELARYEAALATAGPVAVLRGPGAEGALRLASGVRLVDSKLDLVELAAAVERGDYDACPERATVLAVALDAGGDLLVLDLPSVDVSRLPGDAVRQLLELGVLEPLSRSETWNP